jgi:hypothetical protein
MSPLLPRPWCLQARICGAQHGQARVVTARSLTAPRRPEKGAAQAEARRPLDHSEFTASRSRRAAAAPAVCKPMATPLQRWPAGPHRRHIPHGEMARSGRRVVRVCACDWLCAGWAPRGAATCARDATAQGRRASHSEQQQQATRVKERCTDLPTK